VPGLRRDPGPNLPPYLVDRWGPDVYLARPDLVGRGYEPDETMLRADGGDLLGLTRMVAHRG
jgi:hypothetical protein